MNVADITQLIGSVGFPIVACAALFWQMNRQEERQSQVIKELTNAIDELREYIQINIRGKEDVQ